MILNTGINAPHFSSQESQISMAAKKYVNHSLQNGQEQEWFVMINDQRITKGYDKIEKRCQKVEIDH